MHEQIEVVYENGVLRPLEPMPLQLREHVRLTVTIESGGTAGSVAGGLADEARRQSLLASRSPGEREALTFIDNAADTGGPA